MARAAGRQLGTMAVFLAVALAACGGGSDDAASTTTTTAPGVTTTASVPDGCEAHGWEWDAEDPACAPTTTVDDAAPSAPADQPGADPTGGVVVPGPQPIEATSVAGADIDPCTLLTADEWARAAGVSGVVQVPLEEGEACGFTESEDQIRLAIGFVPKDAGGARFLDGAARPGEAVDGLAGAVWVTHYPVDQSSVLVVAQADGDLVLEVSTLDPPTDEQRDAAVQAAVLAQGRL